MNDSPTITHPVDLQYFLSQTGNSISWTVTDLNVGLASYTIYRNDSLIASGPWTSGLPVTRNVDGLAIGSYNYTIVATDGLGGSVQDTVIVNVLNVAPTITHPSDISYVVGLTGNQISWIITDASTGTRGFTLYRNGILIASGSWASGVPVMKNVDGLAIGSYNYTIVAIDGLGGSVQDTVIVNVTSPAPPVTGFDNLVMLLCLLGSVGLVGYLIKKTEENATRTK